MKGEPSSFSEADVLEVFNGEDAAAKVKAGAAVALGVGLAAVGTAIPVVVVGQIGAAVVGLGKAIYASSRRKRRRSTRNGPPLARRCIIPSRRHRPPTASPTAASQILATSTDMDDPAGLPDYHRATMIKQCDVFVPQ